MLGGALVPRFIGGINLEIGNFLSLSLSLSLSVSKERGGKKMGFSARKKEVICMLEADTEARDMTWRSENGADR